MTDATGPLKLTINPPVQDTVAPPAASFWSAETPSFADFLDVINPLQHIPIVSDIYQAMTGDVSSSAANLAGGALFGGPFGFLAALGNEIFHSATGKDVASQAMALVTGQDEGKQYASAEYDYTPTARRAAVNAYVQASLLA